MHIVSLLAFTKLTHLKKEQHSVSLNIDKNFLFQERSLGKPPMYVNKQVHPVDAYFFQLKKMDIQPQKEIVEDFRLMEGKHVHEFFVPWIWSCRLRLC